MTSIINAHVIHQSMKSWSKRLALIAPIIGIILVVNLIINDSLEIILYEPNITIKYTIFTMVTSSDFNQYPYSTVNFVYRVIPLIATIMIAVATVLSVFYKNKKCVISSSALLFISAILLMISHFSLWDNYTVGEASEWYAVFPGFYAAIFIPIFMLNFLLMTCQQYKKENDLPTFWDKH